MPLGNEPALCAGFCFNVLEYEINIQNERNNRNADSYNSIAYYFKNEII